MSAPPAPATTKRRRFRCGSSGSSSGCAEYANVGTFLCETLGKVGTFNQPPASQAATEPCHSHPPRAQRAHQTKWLAAQAAAAPVAGGSEPRPYSEMSQNRFVPTTTFHVLLRLSPAVPASAVEVPANQYDGWFVQLMLLCPSGCRRRGGSGFYGSS